MTNPAEKPETFHSQTGPLSPIRGAPALNVLRVDGGAGRHEPIHRGGVAFCRRKMQRRPASAVAAPKSRQDFGFLRERWKTKRGKKLV